MTTQLDASIGFKKATTFGAPAVVDRFFEFTEESLDFDRQFYQGSGLRVGSRTARSARRVMTRDGAAGDISLEMPTKGAGALFELLLGTAGSTLVADSTAVYQQVFTPIKNDFLPTATIQKGIPQLGGGIDAYTAHGMVCSSFELGMSNSDVLKLKTSWLARQIVTDVAYQTPSYPAAFELFSFVGAGIVVGGGAVTVPTATALATGGTEVANIRDFNFTFDNGLDKNGFNMGGAGLRTRPPAVGLAVPKGKLTAEYDSTDFRDAVRDQEPMAMVATFEGPTEIEEGFVPILQIVLPDIRFDPGELPKTAGGDVITQSLDFSGFDNLVAEHPLYIVMRTADTAL